MIKILTQNGIENTNLDGARDGYFNSGGKDGISSGILNNGTLTAQGNVLTLDTCEMRIKGHRIVIDEPITKTISGFPTVNTNYQFIAKITYNDGSVTFDTEVRPTTNLIQDDILNGNGTYEVVIGEFIHKTDGTIANLVPIMHVIFGGGGGQDGTTFTPYVDENGVISWTNDGGRENPEPVNIKGPQGEQGPQGPTGVGVPTGGTTGQVLKKKSGTDYDTEWGDGDSGGVGQKGTGEGAEIFNSYEGEYANVASGKNSHAEGQHTKALNQCSHAEGLGSEASGARSHAEGESTIASGAAGHAEGGLAKAIGGYSHAEGLGSEASGNYSHAEGYATKSSGIYSHAEGYYTKASGEKQHVQGKFNIEDTENKYAHIVGNGESEIARSNAHTLDWQGNAWYAGKVSGGTEANPAPVEKPNDYVTKKYFDDNKIEVVDNLTTNDATKALSAKQGYYLSSRIVGKKDFSGGIHAYDAEIFNAYVDNVASGNGSHAEGVGTKASGNISHAQGNGTIAGGEYQHAEGKYNVEDTENKYAHIVGNGESNTARSNAHTLDWQGNAWYAGKVSGGTEKYPAPVEKPNDYVTKKYFEEMRKGGLPINEGDTLSKLYFDKNVTPDLSIFTYALDETYGLETCTLILAESGGNSYTLATAKVPTSEDGSTFVYALVYIGADGSLTPLYASGACSFNAIELSAGWQSFSNPILVSEYSITIVDNIVGWNGVWVSKKAFLVDTDDLQNALILTSPNGTKYRIKVADDGTLSTEAVTA